jgi:hypothetical protein
MSPAVQRLLQFVNDAPAGTMVPVESLRDILRTEEGRDDANSHAEQVERRLSPAQAAEWLHERLGGRKRSAAAIRKVMRTGFRGVVLKSYPYGRERRTTEADLRAFVARIGAVPRPATALEQQPVTRITPATPDGFQVKSITDPVDEIAAAQERFRERKKARPRTPQRQRRAAGGG